ncbi:hypothetical protein R1flu_021257 [Riccia fluitans]|uniref:Uncharacterized protein n=1 Tax=Riccia fluitans TaxID=41844 RepID=A0ABD1ZNU9_9MARC
MGREGIRRGRMCNSEPNRDYSLQRDAMVNEESATQVSPITRLSEECPFCGAKARFYTCILPQGSPWALGSGLVSSFWVEGDFN